MSIEVIYVSYNPTLECQCAYGCQVKFVIVPYVATPKAFGECDHFRYVMLLEDKMVRGKFSLREIVQYAYGGESRELVFRAMYDPDLPEDQKYAKATPTGEIKIMVDNPAALAQFELGKSYYVDFTPAGD